jgi:hypothetical protein
MCPWCLGEGDLLYSPAKRLVMASKSKRKRAKTLPCRKRPSFCWPCAFLAGIISEELAARLQDAHFALPAPLSLQQARRWPRP